MNKWTLIRVNLNSGGYDSHGCYFGVDQPLYYFESPDSRTSGYLRASTRGAAKAGIVATYPAATFWR